MPIIKPLRPFRYTESAGALSDLTCPPYDVISPDRQLALYQRSPYNCIRLELTRQDAEAPVGVTRYTQAALTFADWIRRGILRQDDASSLYLYRQTFHLAGKLYSRRGVIGGMLLEPLGGRVKPHERTLAKAKEDRLQLLRAIQTNISPVFALFSDPGDALLDSLYLGAEKEISQEFTDDEGVTHALSRVSDADTIGRFQTAIAGHTAYIADGHHRYEVSLAYAEERRAANRGASGPWDSIMTVLVNMDATGLTILPTHRLVKRGAPSLSESDLAGDFTSLPADLAAMEKIARGEMNPKAIGWYDGLDFRLLIPRLPDIADRDALPGESSARRHLAVSILHNTLLRARMGIDTLIPEGQDQMKYLVAVDEVMKHMTSGDFAHAFFLAPTSIQEVCAVAESGDVMPQKSTFFYPKLGSGFLFNPLNT